MPHDHDAHDHHGHDHGHDHGHHHPAPPAGFDGAFAIGAAANLVFVAAQVGFGLLAHSTALLADAVHNLGDVLGLLLAWGAAVLARRSPSPGRTYGWGRSTVLASLTNAAVVLIGCGAITLEAIERLTTPAPVAGVTVMVVAAVGIVVNGGTALLFARGRHNDLNVRGVFVHMLSDALVSAGVVVAALIITLTGWQWVDPIASLLIVVAIVLSTWRVGRDSVNLALDAVPDGIDVAALERTLLALPDVAEVHDLHVWALSTTDTAMTVHLVRSGFGDVDAIVAEACDVARRLGIGHATVQVESPATAQLCALRPASVV